MHRTSRRLRWRPARIVVAAVCRNTATIADRLREHRALLVPAFPGDAHAFAAWLANPAAPFDGRRTLAVTDLAPHRGPAMTVSALQGRRSAPAYRDYASAAAVVAARRRVKLVR